MTLEYLMQYIGIAIFLFLLLLLFKRKDIKRYIPVGLFSIVYANIWCFIAELLSLWSYPTRLFPFLSVVSIPFNYIALPIIVMVWIIYCPYTLKGKIAWGVSWSLLLISIEFIITRYTMILEYKNGFDVHYSFVLWLFSWYIFFKFHNWIHHKA
ncbi:CBO0543 family protein [Anaerosolibacter sp.]|uniref:CBO0543 family protein n=1 Tax=Anaerosolibacter sp. TaxID=1872527 RepID=UPI0039F0F555